LRLGRLVHLPFPSARYRSCLKAKFDGESIAGSCQPTLRDYGMWSMNASGGGARGRAIHRFVR
jgi:hypothetical protein